MKHDYMAIKAMVTTAIEKRLKDPSTSEEDKKKYLRDLDCLSKHNSDTPLKEHDTDPAIKQFINERYQSLARKFFHAYLHEHFNMDLCIRQMPISDADILFMYRHYATLRPDYTKQIRMRMYAQEPALYRGHGWNSQEAKRNGVVSMWKE